MPKRIFISADIEGITGVVDFKETEKNKDDYRTFRKLMAGEVNAAVEGALEAGIDECYVRDAHGDARNILPEALHRKTRLIRGWADTPLCMMEGIDDSFDAVMFIGYHAAADTPDATLKHTMSLRISEVRLNGILLAEAGLNALIAGMYNIPAVFIAGDRAVCDYAANTFPGIETVAVKHGMGTAAVNMHPAEARRIIYEGARKSIEKPHPPAPFRPDPPYEMIIRYRYEHSAYKAAFYPGTERLNAMMIRFQSDHLMDCFRFFYFCQG